MTRALILSVAAIAVVMAQPYGALAQYSVDTCRKFVRNSIMQVKIKQISDECEQARKDGCRDKSADADCHHDLLRCFYEKVSEAQHGHCSGEDGRNITLLQKC